jgi:acetyl-CoA acetyltransferase
MTAPWSGRGKAAYAGLGFSPVARRWDEKASTSLGALAMTAAGAALADAGLKPSDIDGVFSSPTPLGGLWQPHPVPQEMFTRFRMSENSEDGVSTVSAEWLGRNLDVADGAYAYNTQDMFVLTNAAVDALLSGRCKAALVFRALPSFPGRYNQGGASSGAVARGPAQFELPFGFTGPSYHAMYFQRYLWKYGLSHDAMAPFAVRNRANGLRNSYGFYAQHRPVPLTPEDYLKSPWIVQPISMNDCDLPIMVSVAFVLTTAERARDLRQPPVYVLHQTGGKPAKRSASYTLEDFEAENGAGAKAAWSASGFSPKDMSFAQLYDGYLSMTPLWAEACGLCRPGEGIAFLGSPDADLDGKLPVNTSGGNNGSGRTHGASHIYDAVLQLRRQAHGHQVKDAALALVQVGPPIDWGCQILGREPL